MITYSRRSKNANYFAWKKVTVGSVYTPYTPNEPPREMHVISDSPEWPENPNNIAFYPESSMAEDLKILNAALKEPGEREDYETFRKELGL